MKLENFKNWLQNFEFKKENTAIQYSSAINKLSEHYSQHKGIRIDLYGSNDLNELKKIAELYGLKGKYFEFGDIGHGTYRAAINALCRFRETPNIEYHSKIIKEPNQEIKIKLIGELVKDNIKKIFHYCETKDRDELFRLMDKEYSKKTFNIGYPFCKELSLLTEKELVRYWTNNYDIRNKTLRVCSQWIITSKDLFLDYLFSKRIITEQEFKHYQKIVQKKPYIKKSAPPIKTDVEKELYKETGTTHQNIIIAKEEKQNNYFLSQFDLELRNEAEEMSKHYKTFYCLETSIRKMIVNSMKEKYGNEWWVKKVDFNIREAVKKNMEWELDTVFSKRSKNNIDYTTFGQLRQIVKNNWIVFSKQFRSQSAFNRLMIDLNQLRVPIAHCTPYNKKEVKRLELTVDDWFEIFKK